MHTVHILVVTPAQAWGKQRLGLTDCMLCVYHPVASSINVLQSPCQSLFTRWGFCTKVLHFVWESSGHKLVGIYQNLVGIYQSYIPVISQSDYSICYSYDLIYFIWSNLLCLIFVAHTNYKNYIKLFLTYDTLIDIILGGCSNSKEPPALLLLLSPVYTQRLTRIGIRIKLIQVRVNALTRIRIRIT